MRFIHRSIGWGGRCDESDTASLDIVETLCFLKGEKIVRQALQLTRDRRRLVQVAASLLRISEDVLLEEIAQDLGVSYSPDVRAVSSQDRWSENNIELMCRAGCVLNLSPLGGLEVYCVDPSLVIRMFSGVTKDNVHLASWDMIGTELNSMRPQRHRVPLGEVTERFRDSVHPGYYLYRNPELNSADRFKQERNEKPLMG